MRCCRVLFALALGVAAHVVTSTLDGVPTSTHALPETASDDVAVLSQAPVLVPVTITVGSIPRQTFDRFGWSMVREDPKRGQPCLMYNVTADVREQILSLMCEDLGVGLLSQLLRRNKSDWPNAHFLSNDTGFVRIRSHSFAFVRIRSATSLTALPSLLEPNPFATYVFTLRCVHIYCSLCITTNGVHTCTSLSLQANVVRLWWTPADGAPLQPGHADGNTEFIQGYVESGMIDALQKAGDAEL
jgi:hypothetical protein